MILQFPFSRAVHTSPDNRVAVPIEPVESHVNGKTTLHTHVALTRRQIESILKNVPDLSEQQAREYRALLNLVPR